MHSHLPVAIFGSTLGPPRTSQYLLRTSQDLPAWGMAVLEVKRCLCVNDHAIPGSGDEHMLMCLGDHEDLKVRLVSFKTTQSATWLTNALGLPAKWWSQNHHRIPVILKVLELIRSGKPQTGRAVRMPKQHMRLVQLHIRGRDLWFQNRSECVVLAIRDGLEGLEDLYFFLHELRTDIQEQQLVEVSRAPVQPVDPPPEHLVKDLDEARQTVEIIIGAHRRCSCHPGGAYASCATPTRPQRS